ncbi:MAG: hypothetical protein ABEJ83_02285 [Candidatus Nanohaloarchaea archaeon]
MFGNLSTDVNSTSFGYSLDSTKADLLGEVNEILDTFRNSFARKGGYKLESTEIKLLDASQDSAKFKIIYTMKNNQPETMKNPSSSDWSRRTVHGL